VRAVNHRRGSGKDEAALRSFFEERGEWPDIDLDLPSGDKRERVIRTFMTLRKNRRRDDGNVITYRGRSRREAGRFSVSIDML
jgi:error-prone DNA polymerase